MNPLILASTSPYRQALLEKLGIPFKAVKPHFDEDAFDKSTRYPKDLCEFLAKEKAKSLAIDYADHWIVGGDQLIALGSEIFGKGKTREGAIAQLEKLAGQTFDMVTAMSLVKNEEAANFVTTTRLKMRPITRAQIERYVDADSPMDCAGSFRFETRGIILFEKVEAVDPLVFMGLSLVQLVTELTKRGFEIP